MSYRAKTQKLKCDHDSIGVILVVHELLVADGILKLQM
jgi:hypothetical protein